MVKRMSETFLSTDGDIREVMRTMLKSPEFWSPKVYRAKFKTPLEICGLRRARQRRKCDPSRFAGAKLERHGHVRPYGMESPAGYSMKAETWQTRRGRAGQNQFRHGIDPGKTAGSPI